MTTTINEISVWGCGALGSQIALSIGTPALTLRLLDDDRIEEANVISGTTMYSSQHIGAFKAVALAELLWRLRRCRAVTSLNTLTAQRVTAELITSGLVLDCFDNGPTRALTVGLPVPVLHVAVSDQGTGTVAWDDHYKFDADQNVRGQNMVCTHQLGRNILRLTSAVAAGAVEHFLRSGVKRNFVVTDGLSVWE